MRRQHFNQTGDRRRNDHFVSRVIRYGFTLGKRSSTKEPEDHDLFPRVSRSNLRDRMVERDRSSLMRDIDEFKGNFLALSHDNIMIISKISNEIYFSSLLLQAQLKTTIFWNL
jgi:hypothetical protein